MGSVETGVHGGQAGEAADQEAGADQQHHRQGDFGDDQSAADEAASTGDGAAAVFQRFLMSTRPALKAGASPNKIPVARDTAVAKRKTVASMWMVLRLA